MKSPQSILPGLSLLSLAAFATPAFAATQLPYFGPDMPNCHVAYPGAAYQDVDAGFVASEDCSYIYVLPPNSGSFATRPIQLSGLAQDVCPAFNDAKKSILTSVDHHDSGAMTRALGKVKNMQETLATDFTGTQAWAVGSASLDWNGLIRAYQQANPQLGSQFVAMPVRLGMLSMAAAAPADPMVDDGDDQLLRVRVSSFHPPDNQRNDTEGLLPSYLSYISQDKSSFLMGQAVGLELDFGIVGACGLTATARASDALSGTYTYVYPIQSKGLVRFEFDRGNVTSIVRQYIGNQRNGFSAQGLIDQLRTAHAFNIIINEGAFSDAKLTQTINEFKDDLLAKATDIMLNQLATESAISLKTATWTTTQSHSSTECHGFLFFKSCDTRVWITTESHVDWDRFASDLTENLKVPDIQAQSYRTFYMTSTSAIVSSSTGGF